MMYGHEQKEDAGLLLKRQRRAHNERPAKDAGAPAPHAATSEERV